MKWRKNSFTLPEVLVALAVLSLGVLAATGLLSAARERSRVAELDWNEQHIMAQAAEYFLLAGIAEPIPDRFFPFGGYRVSARYASPAGLPDGLPEEKSGWQLRTLHLQLQNERGEVVRELAVDRIVKAGKL